MADTRTESVTVRPERGADRTTIHALNAAAFPTEAEANLVDALRDDPAYIGLVAATTDGIIGHVAMSPMQAPVGAFGLAPLAVASGWQRRGVGGQLVRAAIESVRANGGSAVFVLGDPAYYGRFGFRAASHWQLASEYEAHGVPAEAFMAVELTPGALDGTPTLVRYHAAFAAL
ncbi:MAG: N-acetyltransferase [Rhodocyclaceae bacterium]